MVDLYVMQYIWGGLLDDSVVKIGRSDNPEGRRAGMESSQNFRMQLTAVFKGWGCHERAVHAHLVARRSRDGAGTEWFYLAASEAVREIGSVVSGAFEAVREIGAVVSAVKRASPTDLECQTGPGGASEEGDFVSGLDVKRRRLNDGDKCMKCPYCRGDPRVKTGCWRRVAERGLPLPRTTAFDASHLLQPRVSVSSDITAALERVKNDGEDPIFQVRDLGDKNWSLLDVVSILSTNKPFSNYSRLNFILQKAWPRLPKCQKKSRGQGELLQWCGDEVTVIVVAFSFLHVLKKNEEARFMITGLVLQLMRADPELLVDFSMGVGRFAGLEDLMYQPDECLGGGDDVQADDGEWESLGDDEEGSP